MKTKLLGAVTAAALVGACFSFGIVPAAQAATVTFNWQWDGGSGGSGQLTAESFPIEYLITSISGTFHGEAITSLLPPGGFNGNDNFLNVSPFASKFNDGIAFSTATYMYNIFGFSFLNSFVTRSDNPVPTHDYCATCESGFFAVQQVETAAIPLPATLPLFATGLGALGLLGWRRKRKQASI